MSEMSVTSSSLAITVAEKKPGRPGGCVGIFYQLFDWNRRLAKKKLFSKKLLPPDRAKRAAKKFGVDDKLPTAKHLLIADENRGGFPISKKSGADNLSTGNGERSHEMRSPSLVARLMGLESMPAVRREKPKKALLSEFNGVHGRNPLYEDNGRCCDDYGCDQDEFRLEKGHSKLDSRPQKLQKTGVFERRSVTRFGAEALQFRSPLSRSKKQHHPKLVSPVKSPRVGKGASRLMGAASKILEPGLQASNRAKCTLTYSPTFHISSRDDTSFHITSRDEAMAQEPPCSALDDRRQASYYPSASKPLKEQSSCKSCGNWLDVVESRPNVGEQVVGNTFSGLGLGSTTPLGPGRNKFKPPESFPLQGRDDVAFQYQGNRRSRNNPSSEMKHVFQEYQEQYHTSSHRVRYQANAAPSTARNLRSKRQNQMLPKERSNMRPSMNNVNGRRDQCGSSSFDGTKDFVSSNRNSVSRTKISVPSRVTNKCIVNTEKNDSSRLGNSIRKKRPITGSGQIENANINQSGLRKQRDDRDDVIIGRRLGASGHSKNQHLIRKELPANAKTDTANNQKDIGVVSFTFSSPMKQKSRSLTPTIGTEKSRDQKLTLDANKAKPLSHVAAHVRGDALGALLEEKLKELNCRDRDELDSGDCPPGRSTAAILEELIVALTAEKPVSVEDEDNCSIVLSQDDSSSCASQDPSNDSQSARLATNQNVKAEAKPPMVFSGFPLGGDSEYHSPGCVLDASFSNDSCFSESLDDYTGNKLCSESVESSYYQPQPSEYDAELSDCATSICTSRTRVIDSLDNIQSVGEKFASEVIGNANLLLRSLCDERDFPIVPLLDNLEALSDAPWTTPNCKMGFMGCNGNSLQRRFLLDSLVEYLDSKCDIYWKSRFKSCPGRRVEINEESLTREVHEEVQRWVDLTGNSSEEILEKELNCSSDKWMDIEVLGFGIGMKMESEIFQGLVDEMVIEFGEYI
ncbi:hypothetical protein ACHQM5_009430 [Ranunculus cassubicifolius]